VDAAASSSSLGVRRRGQRMAAERAHVALRQPLPDAPAVEPMLVRARHHTEPLALLVVPHADDAHAVIVRSGVPVLPETCNGRGGGRDSPKAAAVATVFAAGHQGRWCGGAGLDVWDVQP